MIFIKALIHQFCHYQSLFFVQFLIPIASLKPLLNPPPSNFNSSTLDFSATKHNQELPFKNKNNEVSLEHSSMANVSGPRIYSCCNCRNHVARHDDIISKNFQASHGRAFLFSHAMNIVEGPKENRNLITGLHIVADIYCKNCGVVLGWKYEKAYEESQKYKEGKFILEKFKIMKENF